MMNKICLISLIILTSCSAIPWLEREAEVLSAEVISEIERKPLAPPPIPVIAPVPPQECPQSPIKAADLPAIG